MPEQLTSHPLFGILLTLILYYLSLRLYRKLKIQILNPFLLSMTGILVILSLFNIPLADYMEGAGYIKMMLPLTILLLALPLYRQLPLLLEHKFAILAGVISGVVTSAVSVFLLCRVLKVDKMLLLSLIPKSITTPLGIILTETLGGYVSVTVIAIVITGVLGVLFYVPVFRIFGITHPVAMGIAIGTASHAIGTSKAMELGEVQGAMSGLAIILAGIITVVSAPVFLAVYSLL